MRYYWLRDRQTQQQFNIFWEKGVSNDADYFTKHHAIKEHLTRQSRYVKEKIKQYIKIWYTYFNKTAHTSLCPVRVSYYVT